jgi:hypothetical protein
MADIHRIIEAHYTTEAPDVNYAYVVGQDANGASVSGNAIVAADVTLNGPRLDVRHDTAIPTATVAGAVAAAMLDKMRLSSLQAMVVIPPHCGVELWDIITVVDDGGNQNANYRVSGYTFEMDKRRGVYQHTLDLCAP